MFQAESRIVRQYSWYISNTSFSCDNIHLIKIFILEGAFTEKYQPKLTVAWPVYKTMFVYTCNIGSFDETRAGNRFPPMYGTWRGLRIKEDTYSFARREIWLSRKQTTPLCNNCVVLVRLRWIFITLS